MCRGVHHHQEMLRQRNMPEERRKTRQPGFRRDHKLFLYILEQNQLTQTLKQTWKHRDLPGI